ncbi:MAG: hypothetical protein GY936_16875 [Ignavibacteriae bacterium]|nr:hypothetical protein [Ignavibacteriota bacterium]
MEIFIYIFVVLFGAGILFLIIEYPYHIAGLVIFMTVYRFNIETPLPLDARGLITLVLFARLYFFDKSNASIVNNYLPKNKVFWVIFTFSFIVIIMPVINSEKFLKLFKDIILNLVVLIIGFLVLIDDKGKKVFMYSIIAVSFINSIDLLYTYFTGRGLNVVRVVDVILGRHIVFNHNFPGMLSSLGLLFVYLLYARKEASRILLLILGSLFFVALILSTSRSALLAFILVFILMNFIEVDLKENIRKFVIYGVGAVSLLVVFFFMYNLFLETQSKNQFVDKIYYRLIDEPLQIFGLSDTKDFDIYSHKKKQGSMKFRAEKWGEDFNKFRYLSLSVQGFGLGPKKYSEISKKEYKNAGKYAGNFRRQLAAHNGYLIILVERGVLGLTLYLLILISISVSAFKVIKHYQLKTPVIYLFLFIAFYSFAQNSELVGVYAYLLMGGVLGNIYSANQSNEVLDEEIEKQDHDQEL